MLMRAVTVVAGVVLLIAQAAAQGPARMVVASNARLRERPSEEVPIVAVAPLGADLVELEISPDRGWVRVRTIDGREGWMLEALSRRVPPGQFLHIAEDVIRGRLQRKGDGFAAWMELEAFIDRARRDVADQETAARFALFRLEAIQATAIAGERYNRPVAPAFSAWLTTHAALLVRNESGGKWQLRREVILAEHDRFKDVRTGDQIAWFAVSNGLPGECEGDTPCYLRRDNLLEAEYLRRMPAGALVEMALNGLRERATYYREDLVSSAMLFDPSKQCSDLAKALVPVRAAVAGVDVSRRDMGARRDRALVALDALGAVCSTESRDFATPFSDTASRRR